MLDYSGFYWLTAAAKRTALHVEPAEDLPLDDADALYRSSQLARSPIVFRYVRGCSGSRAYDIISTAYVGMLLIAERVLDILRRYRGWSTFPVRVFGKEGEFIGGYYGLSVIGRCGPIDLSRSKVFWKKPPVPYGKAIRMRLGLYFDEVSWDGSDVFIPQDGSWLIVTSAVRDALVKARITNAKFEQLSEIEHTAVDLDLKERERGF